jgi:tetratricopeptide (TPR) repeat protein
MKAARTPFEEGLAAVERGDYGRAEAIARALFARDREDVHALQLVGFAAFRQGRNREALEAFWRANRVAPGQPALLYWLGVLYMERGDFEQAERAFAQTVRIDPRHAEAWCQLGETLYHLDRQAEAKDAHERALAALPDSPAVLARCARFFETLHDLDRARALAERAHALAPADALAAIALAEIRLREGRCEDVLAIAAPALAGGADRNRAKLLHLSAAALDRIGRCAEAFDRLQAAHALQRELCAERPLADMSPLHPDALSRMIVFLESADLATWTVHADLEEQAPVFLLGFVRSGTTWLDQILSSHPDIAVMEEEDNLQDAWRALTISEEGLARLAGLTRADVYHWRRKYWERARQSLRADVGAPIVVDKLPLNTAQLPLIWRLFPDAKIIFALRDPRDAVLSAYQQLFQINTGMFHFLELSGAAKFYDQVMTIGALTRQKAPLDLCEIRYERLVGDFRSEIARLLDFLEAPWSDAVLSYDETAKARAVRTPSRAQVVEKPYDTSIGKWRRYEKEMAPALDTLGRWAVRFGYPAG